MRKIQEIYKHFYTSSLNGAQFFMMNILDLFIRPQYVLPSTTEKTCGICIMYIKFYLQLLLERKD